VTDVHDDRVGPLPAAALLELRHIRLDSSVNAVASALGGGLVCKLLVDAEEEDASIGGRHDRVRAYPGEVDD
jgi:hypothetical protein